MISVPQQNNFNTADELGVFLRTEPIEKRRSGAGGSGSRSPSSNEKKYASDGTPYVDSSIVPEGREVVINKGH